MIYIGIPSHDEARTLGVLLWKIRKVMAEFGRDYRIVVLDDGSDDGTEALLARYGSVLPLDVVRNSERKGYGRTLEGIVRHVVEQSRYPKRDVLVVLQADFTENPEELVPMVKAIEGGADLVSGTLSESEEGLPTPVRRGRWASRLVLGRTFRRAPVPDPLVGFRAYRLIVLKKALRELDEARPLLQRSGWAANVELLARAAPHARRIEEVPVHWSYGKQQRSSRHRVWAGLRELLPLRGLGWPVAEVAPRPDETEPRSREAAAPAK